MIRLEGDRIDIETVKPYQINFGPDEDGVGGWLSDFASDEALATAVWTVPSGLVSESEDADTLTATIVLSATAAGSYTVECKATSTPGGYVDVFGFEVIVE
jgi:hypothetical protein